MWDESGAGVIVDPGCYDEGQLKSLTDFMDRKEARPVAIWLTHAHPDHIYGVAILQELYDIPVFMHPWEDLEASQRMASRFGLEIPRTGFKTVDIHEGDTLRFGGVEFTVIETPGHTPGGVCFLDSEDKVLLSGDTLFAGSIGRTDMEGGNYDALIVSIMNKLMGLDGDIDVIPGHGEVTDIGWERTHNPFLQPWGEPDEDYSPEETVS